MIRAEARRPLSEASLLTVAEAVRELGGRECETRRWLSDQGLVRDVPGLGRRVSWRQVLALVEVGQGPGAVTAPSRVNKLPRKRLGRE